MLALAICANSTVFSWIDGTMLHPIPGAHETGKLVTLMRGEWNLSPSSAALLSRLPRPSGAESQFAGMLAYNHDWLTLTGGARRSGFMSQRVLELL